MKKCLIILFMALSVFWMVPGVASAETATKEQAEQRRKDSLEKLNIFFDKYVNPDYHLNHPIYASYKSTDEIKAHRAEIHTIAEDIVKDCETQYDKIRALTLHVANRVYYNHSDQISYTEPYKVYTEKIAVCGGYSALIKALCDELKIPCIMLGSYYAHAWNAVYDSEQKRWIFLDASWCSENTYGEGDVEWDTRPAKLDEYFDFTTDLVSNDALHFPYWVDGIRDQKYNTVLYELRTLPGGINYDYSKWRLCVTGMGGKNVKAVSELEGIKVRQLDIGYNGWFDFNTRAIQTIDLSETSIPRITAGAFSRCPELTSIKFPPTLNKVGFNEFFCCEKLKEIDLSNTQISELDIGAFYGCESAKIIKLPSTLTKIGDRAFAVTRGEGEAPVKTTLVTTLSKKQLGIDNKKRNIWGGRLITNFSSTSAAGTYTIRFMKNGGKKGKMANLLCNRGSKVKLPANQFKRAGYKFKGWSTKKNGKGKRYKDQAKVKNLAKANQTVKLYARWKKIKKKN